MSFNQLSAFSLASFEMNAANGGTHAYAGALTDQISLSPQAMGMIGSNVGEYSATTRIAPAPDEYEEYEEEYEEVYEDEQELHPADGVELSSESRDL